MTLLGTIQASSNALSAASLGLQVVGNNIANANTPDYIRERLIQSPGPTQPLGGLLLGTGVQVDGVTQVIDQFLEERLRSASSDAAGSNAQADAYSKLEGAINELGNRDLSTSLTSFFGSINDVLNQPETAAVRGIAVQQGQALAGTIQRLDGHIRGLHDDVNQQIASTADTINNLLSDVAKLNQQILQAEGGSTSKSDAVGLRDRRGADLAKLAEITDIRTVEQPTGDVTVFSGGDFLVTKGTYRTVKVVNSTRDGLPVSEIRIAEIDAPLAAGGGRLGGLTTGRDTVLAGFLGQLDQLSKTLIYEFNKIYSGGQGLSGFGQLAGENAVSDVNAALDEAGLPFTPTNGSFQVQVYNAQTNATQTFDVRVDLNGLDDDTSLTDLAGQLDAINGISASVTADGKLQLASDSPQITFGFANDTSGALAALGVNTFFSGTGSADIGVSQDVRSDPGKFAVSAGGVGEDTHNGELLANLLNAPLDSHGGQSLAALYDNVQTGVAQGAQAAKGAADGLRGFQQTLQSQHLSISGVNIDEEAVQMIQYQRAFQAAAKVISTVNTLLDTLFNL